MEKRILQYANYLRSLCDGEYTKQERKELCGQIIVQIRFFQHERLIHLIVTVLFALMAMVILLLCVVAPSIPAFLLEAMIFVLLIPYIRHYFILENTVQKLVRYYDVICGETWEGSGMIQNDE